MLREEQMDMLMMMEQMEKLQEICPGSGSFSDCSSEFTSYIGYNVVNGTSDLHGYGSVGAPVMGTTYNYTHVNSEPAMISQVLAGASSSSSSGSTDHHKASSVAAMREMIFRIAAMQPVNIDPESVKPPKRRNVKISTDPQSVAARHRRERISERIRILQRLVPGGTKMDTASMLDEAIHYVKFLKTQVQSLERAAADRTNPGIGVSGAGGYLSVGRNYQSGNQIMFPSSTQLFS